MILPPLVLKNSFFLQMVCLLPLSKSLFMSKNTKNNFKETGKGVFFLITTVSPALKRKQSLRICHESTHCGPPKPLSLGTEGFSKELSRVLIVSRLGFSWSVPYPLPRLKGKGPGMCFLGVLGCQGQQNSFPAGVGWGHCANTFISGHTTVLQDRETDLLS